MRPTTTSKHRPPAEKDGFPSDPLKTTISVQRAIELLRKNGIEYPGLHVIHPEQITGLNLSEGCYVVKAAVMGKKKIGRGEVVFTEKKGLEFAVHSVLEAMRSAGDDVSSGVIIQPEIKRTANSAEVLVSVEHTIYGTITTVKIGGPLAEENTKAIRILGGFDLEKLAAQIETIPGIPKHAGLAIARIAEGIQKTISANPEIGSIELNPVICTNNRAVAVDVRMFTRELPVVKKESMPQTSFELQMSRALNPKLVVFVMPAESPSESPVRYLMTLNALKCERDGRVVAFVHSDKEILKITRPDGTQTERVCFRNLMQVHSEYGIAPDLVVIAQRPDQTIKTVDACSVFGSPVIMIGSGFGEVGERGQTVTRDITAIFDRGRIIGFGPNTVGIFNPTDGLDASFDAYDGIDGAKPHIGGGKITLTTQGGGICSILCSSLTARGVPIKHAMAIGNGNGVNVHQIVRYHNSTESAVDFYYVENDPGPEFIKAISEITRQRPVVVLKGGRFEENPAARTHTGANFGSYDAFKMAAEKAGAIVVENSESVPLLLEVLQTGVSAKLADRISTAKALEKNEPGIQIISQSGGDGVEFMDLLLNATKSGVDIKTATPDAETVARIQAVIGNIISVNPNPIDLGPASNLEEVLNAINGNGGIGMIAVVYNKYFYEWLIPENNGKYPFAVLTLTNDQALKGEKIARERGWIVSRSKQHTLEMLSHVYNYARWLTENR